MSEEQMADDSANQHEWKPPYVAYTTLVGLIDNKLGTNPLPPRIDRGFLDSYAGSVQAMLLSTLRVMGLIDDQGNVLEPLRAATQQPGLRKSVFRAWAVEFYAEQQTLAGQNATAQMLHESFAKRKITGSTLRKAVVFYLSLVDDVGLDKSPHFKPPRQTNPSGGKPRKRPTPTAVAEAVSPPSETSSSAETMVLQLGEAGTVTVSVDVKWLQLPMDKFTRLRQILAELEFLSDSDAPPEPRTQEDDGAA